MFCTSYTLYNRHITLVTNEEKRKEQISKREINDLTKGDGPRNYQALSAPF